MEWLFCLKCTVIWYFRLKVCHTFFFGWISWCGWGRSFGLAKLEKKGWHCQKRPFYSNKIKYYQWWWWCCLRIDSIHLVSCISGCHCGLRSILEEDIHCKIDTYWLGWGSTINAIHILLHQLQALFMAIFDAYLNGLHYRKHHSNQTSGALSR